MDDMTLLRVIQGGSFGRLQRGPTSSSGPFLLFQLGLRDL